MSEGDIQSFQIYKVHHDNTMDIVVANDCRASNANPSILYRSLACQRAIRREPPTLVRSATRLPTELLSVVIMADSGDKYATEVSHYLLCSV